MALLRPGATGPRKISDPPSIELRKIAAQKQNVTRCPADGVPRNLSEPQGHTGGIVIGIVLYAIGAINYALGPNLQAYAIATEAEAAAEEGREARAETRLGLWILGVLLYTTAGIFWAVATAFATAVEQGRRAVDAERGFAR